MSLQSIETLTLQYSDAQSELDDAVAALQQTMEQARRAAMPEIRKLVKKAMTAKGRLSDAIEAEPELFVKPRSYVWAGIRAGIKKGNPGFEYEDEAAVIKRIEKFFAEDGDQQELLIKTEKSLRKDALKSLTVADLKKIGVVPVQGEDNVIIVPVEDQIAKAVKAMQKAASKVEDAVVTED